MAGLRSEGILQVNDDGGGGPTANVEIVGPLGSQPAADSVSVAIASDQLPLPVSATIDPTGLATEAKQDDQITQLADLVSALDVALSTRASEATVASILTALAGILDVDVQNFPAGFDVNNFPAGFDVNNPEDFFQALDVATVNATASGDTQILASGTRKIKRIEASNVHASVDNIVGIKIASINGGAEFGLKYLPFAGGQAVWVFPNSYLQVTAEIVEVTCSAAGDVEFTIYYY